MSSDIYILRLAPNAYNLHKVHNVPNIPSDMIFSTENEAILYWILNHLPDYLDDISQFNIEKNDIDTEAKAIFYFRTQNNINWLHIIATFSWELLKYTLDTISSDYLDMDLNKLYEIAHRQNTCNSEYNLVISEKNDEKTYHEQQLELEHLKNRIRTLEDGLSAYQAN